MARRSFFKGGTSLSKVFGIIDRFSEDIDLIIDRGYFGYKGAADIASAPTKTAARKRMEQLGDEIAHYIATELLPALQTQFSGILAEPFRLQVDPEGPQTIRFSYPTENEHAYIHAMVLIETGGNADSWPTVERTIRPYVAEQIPDAFESDGVVVRAIDAVRTFWEKLTILHKTAHRFDGHPEWELATRYSRHYYDVYQLSRAGVAGDHLADIGLIDAVRFAAQTYFADSRAKYEEFAPGSIRLIPGDNGIAALRRDYEQMRELIFGVYPTLDEIIAELRRIDCIVNR